MFSYFFNYNNYNKPETKKPIYDDTIKYYKHIKLMKDLKKFTIYKKSPYLKALLKYKNK